MPDGGGFEEKHVFDCINDFWSASAGSGDEDIFTESIKGSSSSSGIELCDAELIAFKFVPFSFDGDRKSAEKEYVALG